MLFMEWRFVMTGRKILMSALLCLSLALAAGCASSGYSGVIPVAGATLGPDTPARRMTALNAAEQVLLSKGYTPVTVVKDKGFMNFLLEADSDTVYKVNVRLVDVQSGKNDVEMDIDMKILRSGPKTSGLSIGGGIGFGTGGGSGFGLGVATGARDYQDDDIKFSLKKEIAAAVEKALAQ